MLFPAPPAPKAKDRFPLPLTATDLHREDGGQVRRTVVPASRAAITCRYAWLAGLAIGGRDPRAPFPSLLLAMPRASR